jgi:hypothetical protein
LEESDAILSDFAHGTYSYITYNDQSRNSKPQNEKEYNGTLFKQYRFLRNRRKIFDIGNASAR